MQDLDKIAGNTADSGGSAAKAASSSLSNPHDSGFEKKAESAAASLIAATGNDMGAAMEHLIAAHKRATALLAQCTEVEIQLAQVMLRCPHRNWIYRETC